MDKYSSRNFESIFRVDDDFEELVLETSQLDYSHFYRPITGLHKIHEYVKQLNGLIYIRSNDRIVSRYFPNKNNFIDRSSNDQLTKKYFGKTPRKFNGTIIQLLFPLREKRKAWKQIKTPVFSFPELGGADKRVVLSLVEYLEIFDNKNDAIRIKKLKEFYQRINTLRTDNKNRGVILDCHDGENGITTHNKYFLIIVSILITSQGKEFTNTLINVPNTLLDFLKASFNNKDGYEYPPLVYFDNNFQRGFLSIQDDEEVNLKKIFSHETIDYENEKYQKLISNFHTLFVNLGTNENPKILFSHNRKNIIQAFVTIPNSGY